LRRTGDPRAITAAIRSEIRAIDPELPVPQFLSMEEIVDSSVAQRRFQLRLILLFGVASVLLSTKGSAPFTLSVMSQTADPEPGMLFIDAVRILEERYGVQNVEDQRRRSYLLASIGGC
jgi:hypothetical protein